MDTKASYQIALEPIGYLGYALIPHDNNDVIINALANIKSFFSKNQNYKQSFNNPGIKEFGYYDLGYKEFFAIRNQQLPDELSSCILLFECLRILALDCLQVIAEKMQWDPTLLPMIIQKSILPSDEKSSSLLRLLNYHPQSSNNYACQMHQDLGLLSIVICTETPALEIYDYIAGDWVDIETQAKPFDAIIMVGETLTALSNGKLLPATHRVRCIAESRTSIVYQLRADPDAMLDSVCFETAITKQFQKPFKLTGEAFYNHEIQSRTSVNGSY